jgi:hypothetical protein
VCDRLVHSIQRRAGLLHHQRSCTQPAGSSFVIGISPTQLHPASLQHHYVQRQASSRVMRTACQAVSCVSCVWVHPVDAPAMQALESLLISTHADRACCCSRAIPVAEGQHVSRDVVSRYQVRHNSCTLPMLLLCRAGLLYKQDYYRKKCRKCRVRTCIWSGMHAQALPVSWYSSG